MKPFNLEKALAGEPVVTRDGTKVTEIHNFSTRHGEMTVFAIIEGSFLTFSKSGKHYSTIVDSEFDLFMADTEKWVNVYYNKEKDLAFCSETYESEIEARTGRLHTHYITTIQVRK